MEDFFTCFFLWTFKVQNFIVLQWPITKQYRKMHSIYLFEVCNCLNCFNFVFFIKVLYVWRATKKNYGMCLDHNLRKLTAVLNKIYFRFPQSIHVNVGVCFKPKQDKFLARYSRSQQLIPFDAIHTHPLTGHQNITVRPTNRKICRYCLASRGILSDVCNSSNISRVKIVSYMKLTENNKC
jgi:hypothetical protein